MTKYLRLKVVLGDSSLLIVKQLHSLSNAAGDLCLALRVSNSSRRSIFLSVFVRSSCCWICALCCIKVSWIEGHLSNRSLCQRKRSTRLGRSYFCYLHHFGQIFGLSWTHRSSWYISRMCQIFLIKQRWALSICNCKSSTSTQISTGSTPLGVALVECQGPARGTQSCKIIERRYWYSG